MGNSKLEIKKTNHVDSRLRLTLVVSLTATIIYLLIALFSFNINDPGWSSISSENTIKNYAGAFGAYLASFILSLFGIVGFILPFLLVDHIRTLLLKKSEKSLNYLMPIIKIFGIFSFILACSGLSELYLNFNNYWLPQRSGGIIGYEVVKFTTKYLGTIGGSFILLATLFIGLTLYSGTTWIRIIKNILIFILNAIKYTFQTKAKTPNNSQQHNFGDFNDHEKQQTILFAKKHSKENTSIATSKNIKLQRGSTDENENNKKIQVVEPLVSNLNNLAKDDLPSLDLLINPEIKKTVISQQELSKTSSLLEQTLNDFGINAKVIAAHPGPIITRYEVELARGTKASRLTSISQDLARALSIAAVRVVEVIPGKPYVGLEVPNSHRQIVRIKEVLSEPEFLKSKAPTLMGIGVDISGKPVLSELAKMPHLLVAGTTGSGKSVGVNAMILSMLYKCIPDELKFIMIDPKMLELSIYDGIPHLLTPVVTDMTEAANSLRWCVKEMERRYVLMSAVGVRNISLLNDKIEQAEKIGKSLKDTMFIKMNPERAHEAPTLTKMPYIVIVADEFADMIMVVGKKVEELIARLAQKARAAGIHIILATQRPSVDVVTGLIKANIPTRMSFQVSSRIDSRTILDQQGAEQLLGQGDMLYLKPGFSTPMRIHGAFVDDSEVHKVVASWKNYGAPEYIESILESTEGGNEITSSSDDDSEDPLYNQAVEIVVQTQKASISAVQRKFKIGYNRSARLMEEMETNNIVSEMSSNGMRQVLIKREN